MESENPQKATKMKATSLFSSFPSVQNLRALTPNAKLTDDEERAKDARP